jgi:hypothetical protein
MDKEQADYFLRRIYRLIKSEEFPILLKRLKGKCGETNFETIKLNPKHPLLPTFLHECLHIFYPDYSETKILALEEQVFSKLTIRQLNNLLLRLALAINNFRQP